MAVQESFWVMSYFFSETVALVSCNLKFPQDRGIIQLKGRGQIEMGTMICKVCKLVKSRLLDTPHCSSEGLG